ncbi:tail fiber protein [Bradyrhizobium sp. SZCCHNRI1073]|uniref:tail fiber protein n=1 Tax=Bradyrhizobium sp. SZCCHNRI1073 TaxID=3057280 RepID=UPI0029168987|nr:tail fiber protein [Bradyrhizobium sp. SZCCHNRI1073]
MGLFHFKWSRTAASNATADSNVNWAEGMAPSAVNDSARAMMASAAGFRDDIAGAITTSGTSTAYTVTSYQVFDSLANMSGHVIAFTPHTTNGATVTLNVDGLGAKPLRSAPSVELAAGTLVAGTPYTALYNNSDAAWYLHNFFGANPYHVPLGAGMDYWGSSTPNSSFAFPTGQQISQTTYASLYALFGPNKYGADGGGLFYLPNKSGRVSAMKESSATRLTSTYFGGDSTSLGATGGSESQTLTLNQLPTGIQSRNASFNISTTTSSTAVVSGAGAGVAAGGNFITVVGSSSTLAATGTVAQDTVTSTSYNTGGTAHPTVQPTIVCNYIIRII